MAVGNSTQSYARHHSRPSRCGMVACLGTPRQGDGAVTAADSVFLGAARWELPPRIQEEERLLLGADSLLLAQLLWNRGVRSPDDAAAFLDPERSAYHDPNLMLGMPQAVRRLSRALADGETIAIYGDYDVDGLSGAALLSHALRRL